VSTLGPILPYNGTVPSGTDLFTTEFLRTIPDQHLYAIRGRVDEVLNDRSPQYTLNSCRNPKPSTSADGEQRTWSDSLALSVGEVA
jgi:hypothetical protein